jgi:hypothetical protein
MQDAGPGSAVRTGPSGQLSGVTVTGRSPWRALRNRRRLRRMQEAYLLGAVARRSVIPDSVLAGAANTAWASFARTLRARVRRRG